MVGGEIVGWQKSIEPATPEAETNMKKGSSIIVRDDGVSYLMEPSRSYGQSLSTYSHLLRGQAEYESKRFCIYSTSNRQFSNIGTPTGF